MIDQARELDELRIKNAQLEQALRSRIVIEQAKGVLAERYRLDLDRAFEILRSASRSNRIRIHELAAAVVSSPRTPTAIELALLGSKPGASARAASPSASRR